LHLAVAQRRRLRGSMLYAVLLTYFLLSALPFLWIVTMSLKAPPDVIAIPPKITFTPIPDNYLSVLLGMKTGYYDTARVEIPRAFRNSVIVAGGATALAIVLGNLAAFAMARLRMPLRETFAFFFLSFRFAPALTFIIPLYVVFRTLKLYNTHLGLILAYQIVAIPLMVWTMRSYYETIPRELFESARIDGAGWLQAFWRVALPLAAPGLAATSILTFIACWNNFTFPLLLGARETQTVTLATITFIGYEEVLWGQMAAAAVVTMVPELILALIVQRYIVRGLTMGAVKE
jgi:multiple sugar transport system permease protein